MTMTIEEALASVGLTDNDLKAAMTFGTAAPAFDGRPDLISKVFEAQQKVSVELGGMAVAVVNQVT